MKQKSSPDDKEEFMKNYNILFTSSGRRVSLIQNFKKSLQELGVAGRVVTADLKKDAPSWCVADAQELVPRVTDPEYVPVLKKLCEKYDIDLLVPLIDTELPVLAERQAEFKKFGCQVLISSPETIQISMDKKNTSQFFERVGVATPKILDIDHRDETTYSFPSLIKPTDGSCSVGVPLCQDRCRLYNAAW